MLTVSRRILYMVLGGIMALVIVGAGIVGGTAVFAQDDTSTPTTNPEVTSRNGHRGDQRPDRDQFDGYLAEALGISVDELEAAREIAREAAIAQAVADGVITQEEADLRAAGQALRDYLDHDAVLAELLGLSLDEIAAARDDGSLRDLVAAAGLSQEDMMAAMETAWETAVAEAVADGVITQEQADQLQETPRRGGGKQGGPRDRQDNGGGSSRGGGPGI